MEVPESLGLLAQACLDAAGDLDDAWNAAQTGLVVAPRAGGNTAGGFDVVTAHQAAADDASTALGRLSAVLEIDADAVYLAAFDFSMTDEVVARTFESDYRDPDEPSDDPGPSPTPSPDPVV